MLVREWARVCQQAGKGRASFVPLEQALEYIFLGNKSDPTWLRP